MVANAEGAEGPEDVHAGERGPVLERRAVMALLTPAEAAMIDRERTKSGRDSRAVRKAADAWEMLGDFTFALLAGEPHEQVREAIGTEMQGDIEQADRFLLVALPAAELIRQEVRNALQALQKVRPSP